uniref:Predicted nucleic acid-binding protein, contains PIN domain n=1 Tax=Candidatus Kentrum sp. MB TaxID=2138164 RepID=A0A450XJ86_9GAMM|nr:MAG: Predicted nucleic acid-binding protein, contains PIN domain [Candidatus Kentron sp. MB]VFK29383.1 MAG: Predicted nucleic acid-binding protein, contains PIN domain [Candidatus Kentron sp. MB]VFK74770.1 MAG: Predicted nucleic acid-binding protein, contains PIN domain [Candidatus Kentron sp. MB]
MKSTVYIETSIISYLTARSSNDIRQAARRNSTIEWWEKSSRNFDVFVSEYVLIEAARGNPKAAEKRLNAIATIPILETTRLVRKVAESLLNFGALPRQAELDAHHIAIATAHGMEYLLTWNCRHIANAVMRPKIEIICLQAKCEPPVICTPDELMPDESMQE